MSRSSHPNNTQNQHLDANKPRNRQLSRAQPTNQLSYKENYNYLKSQTSLVPQFPGAFIHVQLGLENNKKVEVPKSNQTTRTKRKRQINSHLPNPNNMMVVQVPQNHTNLLQVPHSAYTTKLESQQQNQHTNQKIQIQTQKVQIKSKEGSFSQVMQDKTDFMSSMQIDANKVEKYFGERQKKSQKYATKTKKQGRIQNSGVYLISVSESVADNKGMDKAHSFSNQTRDTYNQSQSGIVSDDIKNRSIHTPPSIGAVSSFNFKREKMFWRSFVNPHYILNTKQGAFVINAQKQYAHFNSYYSISTSKKEYSDTDEGYLGYLQGNFTGSQFNLYQYKDSKHEVVGSIYYVCEFSCSQSHRSIQVYFKHPLLNSLGDQKGSLKDLYSKEQNANSRSIIKLVNKQPVWNNDMNCYLMSFHGKSKYGSIKNTILVQEGNPRDEIMLFCKTGEHDFLLQTGYPLTSFVAMGVILSSFDFKLCCQ